MIKYYSTNKKSNKVSFKEALFLGQAIDKGLFMPESIPKLNIKKITTFKSLTYPEIAFEVLYPFLKDEIPDSVLKKITQEAYDFDVPIEKIEPGKFILRLDRGPSASFKDFAARLMARIMNYLLEKENKKLNILVATSGDTGGAVADAFYFQGNINVTILFPKDEVTSTQRKQMTTIGKNIKAIAVNGKFDDCQNLVKQALTDQNLRHLNLSSANSINICRLLPQAVYYFYSYSRIVEKPGEKIVFCVPSGNFGNLMGGLIAKNMGLPVKRFVVCVNENDEFLSFLKTSIYKPIIPSIGCISNAMNVGHPSNLARIIELYGGNMDEKGKICKMPDLKKIKKELFAVSITDEATKKTIIDVYQKNKTLLEPHGAVAYAGMNSYISENKELSPIVVIETAQPSKFKEELIKLGISRDLLKSMDYLDRKKEVDEITINNDYGEFMKILN